VEAQAQHVALAHSTYMQLSRQRQRVSARLTWVRVHGHVANTPRLRRNPMIDMNDDDVTRRCVKAISYLGPRPRPCGRAGSAAQRGWGAESGTCGAQGERAEQAQDAPISREVKPPEARAAWCLQHAHRPGEPAWSTHAHVQRGTSWANGWFSLGGSCLQWPP
jgi:hypothetical protein